MDLIFYTNFKQEDREDREEILPDLPGLPVQKKWDCS
jgi:hypothetical protein